MAQARVPRRPSIFINCPFDPEFLPFLRAILFTVLAMGCKPRSALEESDSSALRLEKIYKLINNCRFLIHDLSRTELSHSTALQHAVGAGYVSWDEAPHVEGASEKDLSGIFVKDKHNTAFITDINGLDVEGHGNQPEKVISSIRNWLCIDARITGLPASVVRGHFGKFEADLPEILNRIGYEA